MRYFLIKHPTPYHTPLRLYALAGLLCAFLLPDILGVGRLFLPFKKAAWTSGWTSGWTIVCIFIASYPPYNDKKRGKNASFLRVNTPLIHYQVSRVLVLLLLIIN